MVKRVRCGHKAISQRTRMRPTGRWSLFIDGYVHHSPAWTNTNLANQREGIGGQPSQASIAGGPGREETHLYQSLRKIGHRIAFNEVLTVVIINKGLRSSPLRGRKIGEL